jgi:hypothetical protein
MRNLIRLAALALSISMAQSSTGAHAQQVAATQRLRPPQITGDLIADTRANLGLDPKTGASNKTDLLQALNQITIVDLDAAVQIFDTFKNPNGKACAAAWLDLLKANEAVDAKTLPEPHLFSDLAKLYNLHVATQSGAPLKTACAAMKDDLGSGLLGGLGGVATISKLTPLLGLFGL